MSATLLEAVAKVLAAYPDMPYLPRGQAALFEQLGAAYDAEKGGEHGPDSTCPNCALEHEDGNRWRTLIERIGYAQHLGAESLADSIIALRNRVLAAEKGGEAAWPTVDAFAAEMRRLLTTHKAKKGGAENWRKDAPADLLRRVREEVDEVGLGLAARLPPDGILARCADVANMAHMVADAYANQRSTPPSGPVKCKDCGREDGDGGHVVNACDGCRLDVCGDCTDSTTPDVVRLCADCFAGGTAATSPSGPGGEERLKPMTDEEARSTLEGAGVTAERRKAGLERAMSMVREARAKAEGQAEPTVTHAQFAAVVESYSADCKANALREPTQSVSFWGQSHGAREVLRLAASGQVPRVLLESEVCARLSELAEKYEHSEDTCNYVGKDATRPRSMRDAVDEVRNALGLTLDAPTSGPEGVEPRKCASTLLDCRGTSTRACGRCDACCGHARGVCATNQDGGETWCGCERDCLDDSGHCEKHGHQPSAAPNHSTESKGSDQTGHEDCPDSPACPGHFPYCEGVGRDLPPPGLPAEPNPPESLESSALRAAMLEDFRNGLTLDAPTSGHRPRVMLEVEGVVEVLADAWAAADEVSEVDAEPGSDAAARTAATIRETVESIAEGLEVTLPRNLGGSNLSTSSKGSAETMDGVNLSPITPETVATARAALGLEPNPPADSESSTSPAARGAALAGVVRTSPAGIAFYDAPRSRVAPTPDVPSLTPVPGMKMPPLGVQAAINAVSIPTTEEAHAEMVAAGMDPDAFAAGAQAHADTVRAALPASSPYFKPAADGGPAPSCRRPSPLSGPTCASLGCGEHGADKPCQWPAAPEVLLEEGDLRVLENGHWLMKGQGMKAGAVCDVLARALAEAKRERAEYADVAARALVQAVAEAAQLGAESMRARAAALAKSEFDHGDESDRVRDMLANVVTAILALPLDVSAPHTPGLSRPSTVEAGLKPTSNPSTPGVV